MDLETLKHVCGCLEDIKEDEFNLIWDRFVRFLSHITCWDIDGDTILTADRVQAYDLNQQLCQYSCLTYQPYWKNIDHATIQVEIRQYRPDGVTIIPVSSEFVTYDDFRDLFFVDISKMMSFGCVCDESCVDNVLIFKYRAGYDLDSPEWLDLICHYFTGFKAIANNCMSIDDCCSASTTQIGSRLVTKKVGDISYSWKVDENSQEVFFKQLINNYYRSVLGKYALCGRDWRFINHIWIGRSDDESTL